MATAREIDLVTVAAVRTGDRKTVEYLFNERQRIYVLADRAAADDQSARRLKAALAKKRPIKVALNAKRGTIELVSEPTGRRRRRLGHLPPEAASALSDSATDLDDLGQACLPSSFK